MRINKTNGSFQYIPLDTNARRQNNKIVSQGYDTVELSANKSPDILKCYSKRFDTPKISAVRSKIESGYYLSETFSSKLVGSLINNPKFLADIGGNNITDR